MSLDHPTYVASLQNNIRARPISWEGAVRSRTITEGELKKIKAIDKVRKEQRRQTIESDITGYRSLLLGDGQSKSIFQSAVKRPDIVQYMLVLTEDLIEGEQSEAYDDSLAWPLTDSAVRLNRYSWICLCYTRA